MKPKFAHIIRAGLLLILFAFISCSSPEKGIHQWRTYQGDNGRNQFSSLDRINTGNVKRLALAWSYSTGDVRERSQMQCNPIVIDTIMYATSPQLKVLALNAATGALLWRFDPFEILDETGKKREPVGLNRGVMYWQEGSERRIFFSAGHYLHSLDAMTGALIPSFGQNGRVDIREGLDRDVSELTVMSHTPGAIYKNLIILGTMVSEGPTAAPGHVRAYDARTGARRWIFHTIPHPGEFGYDTWPGDAWQRIGGANSWSGMSLDEKRGIVYVPTGSASFDFYGGNRHGMNLFANSIIALNAETGERVWHFQTVRHDIWDRDLPCPPNLITVNHNGKKIDAVAQATKAGIVYLLDRETGIPLFPVEERSASASQVPGEETWPAQPYPLLPPPFTRTLFREEDVTDISPEAHAFVLERLKKYRSKGEYEPSGFEGTVLFPGYDGGAGWGGAAADPDAGIMYVNAKEDPCLITIVPTQNESKRKNESSIDLGKRVYNSNCAACHGNNREGDKEYMYPALLHIDERLEREAVREIVKSGKGNMPAFEFLSGRENLALLDFLYGTQSREGVHFSDEAPDERSIKLPYTFTGYTRFRDMEGYPAVKPPWGTLTAIDLNRGEIKWQVVLGEEPALAAKGLQQTGSESYGGPVVTGGGLIFIAATKDEKFRAFDRESGAPLWEAALPAAGYATPCTYEVNGRQFVVIACGGGKLGTKSGDTYVAFALPEERR